MVEVSPVEEKKLVWVCLYEHEIDSIENALRERKDALLGRGEVGQADEIERVISALEKVPVCFGGD